MDYLIEYYYDLMAVCDCSEFNLNKCCRNGSCFYCWQLEAALISIEMGWY